VTLSMRYSRELYISSEVILISFVARDTLGG
jgi:hypothetical protein